MAIRMYHDKYEWLAQHIWNEEYPKDYKGEFVLYLDNYKEFKKPINYLVEDVIFSNYDSSNIYKYEEYQYRVRKVEEDEYKYIITRDNGGTSLLKKEYWVIPEKWDNIIEYKSTWKNLLNRWVTLWFTINWNKIFYMTEKEYQKKLFEFLLKCDRERVKRQKNSK